MKTNVFRQVPVLQHTHTAHTQNHTIDTHFFLNVLVKLIPKRNNKVMPLDLMLMSRSH